MAPGIDADPEPPSAAVQREHERGAEPFLCWMTRRHFEQFREHFLIMSLPELGIEAALQHLKAQSPYTEHELAAQCLWQVPPEAGLPFAAAVPSGSADTL